MGKGISVFTAVADGHDQMQKLQNAHLYTLQAVLRAAIVKQLSTDGSTGADAEQQADSMGLAAINSFLGAHQDIFLPHCHTLEAVEAGTVQHGYGAGSDQVPMTLLRASSQGEWHLPPLLLKHHPNPEEKAKKIYRHHLLLCEEDLPLATYGAIAMCYEPADAWQPCQIMLSAAATLTSLKVNLPPPPPQGEFEDMQSLLHKLAQRIAHLGADDGLQQADANIIFDCALYLAEVSHDSGAFVDKSIFDAAEDDDEAFAAGDLVLEGAQLVLPLRLAQLLRLAFGAGLGQSLRHTLPVMEVVQRTLQLQSLDEVLAPSPHLRLRTVPVLLVLWCRRTASEHKRATAAWRFLPMATMNRPRRGPADGTFARAIKLFSPSNSRRFTKRLGLTASSTRLCSTLST
jgi:hypothetical protein